mmetsp:Transcript_25597/g.52530  ORF Transcript_25597/g.52530 Transcript_25597/m.52530 type:complete len:505 (+) Transcript_25597:165-1679(+)
MIFHPQLISRLSSNDPTLTSVSFLGDKLTFDDCIVLANAISSNTYLEKLWLDNNMIGDEDVSPILKTLTMGRNNRGHPNLKQLYITRNSIGDGSAEMISELLSVAKLQQLCLNNNRIGNIGASILASSLSSPHGSELLALKLNSNEIADEGAMSFAKALDPFRTSSSRCGDLAEKTPKLKTLHLRANRIGLEGGMALANRLRQNDEIKCVALQENEIPEGILRRIEEICEWNNLPQSKRKSIGEKRISVIRNSKSGISPPQSTPNDGGRDSLSNRDMDVEETIASLETRDCNCAFQEIKIFNEELCPTTLARLCHALSSYHNHEEAFPLKTLWLNSNNIGDKGMTMLAITVAKLPRLQKLYITKNNISDFGATQLANALKEPTCQLQELWLSNNMISDDGAKALADSLRVNKTLIEVRLNQNCIGNIGAGQLGYVLSMGHHPALSILSLKGNMIGDAGGYSFLANIASENSIRVYMEDKSISKEIENQLKISNTRGDGARDVII